jgi:hypothetical protein
MARRGSYGWALTYRSSFREAASRGNQSAAVAGALSHRRWDWRRAAHLACRGGLAERDAASRYGDAESTGCTAALRVDDALR